MIARPGLILLVCAVVVACNSAPPLSRVTTPTTADADSRFASLAHEILADHYAHYPSQATDLGIHTFDAQLEDVSAAAIAAESQTAKTFRAQLAAIDPTALTLTNALDQQQLILAMDAQVLDIDTIRMWQKDPDQYSSGITNAAFVLIAGKLRR